MLWMSFHRRGAGMTKNSGKFAGLLDSYLHQAGLPLRRVASQAGIPHQTLFNWLNGTQPRWHAALPQDLHRLGDTLGLAENEMTQLLRVTGCMAAQPLTFEAQEVPMENSYRMPKGWFVGGDAPETYDLGVDPNVTFENHPCIAIVGHPDSIDFAGLGQSFNADFYHGKRVRYSAAIRSVDVDNRVALWMRVDGANGKILAFDNMKDRFVTGTTDWAHYSIVLDVSEEAEKIFLGFLMAGNGQAWVGDIHLDIVGMDVPTTDIEAEIAPYFPANLGFDE
jgi:hypothetical protein